MPKIARYGKDIMFNVRPHRFGSCSCASQFNPISIPCCQYHSHIGGVTYSEHNFYAQLSTHVCVKTMSCSDSLP